MKKLSSLTGLDIRVPSGICTGSHHHSKPSLAVKSWKADKELQQFYRLMDVHSIVLFRGEKSSYLPFLNI